MNEIKIIFGTELKRKLINRIPKEIIARWAYDFYLANCKNISKDFEFDIMKIVTLEEGLEFDINIDDLNILAEKYLKGGK